MEIEGFEEGTNRKQKTALLRQLIIVHRGVSNEYTGGPGGPDTGFCGPGGGSVVINVLASHYVY